MAIKHYIEKIRKKEPFCLIRCEGGYYTKYASYEKNVVGRYKEFGDRLVGDPSKHCMVEFSTSVAYSDYGKEKLKEIEKLGFKNPQFVTLYRADCTIIFE